MLGVIRSTKMLFCGLSQDPVDSHDHLIEDAGVRSLRWET